MGMIKRLIKGNETLPNKPWFFFVLMAVFFLTILVFDGIATQLANLLTGYNKNRVLLAASPELANANWRSRQMITAAMAIIVFIPAFLTVASSKNIETTNTDSDFQDATFLIGGLVLVFPVLVTIGVSAIEVMQKAPEIYRMVSNLMVAISFVLVALLVVPFRYETVLAITVILTGLTMQYSIGHEMGSRLVVAVIIGFVFMLVKFSGKKILESIGSEANDVERLAYLGAPMLIFTGLWLIRSYAMEKSYEAPLTLFVFTLGYVWVYYDTASATAPDYILKGKDDWANIGVDWVLVTAILMCITSISRFGYNQVNGIEKASGETLNITTTVIKLVIGTIVGYIGALVYNKCLTDKQIETWLVSLQDFSNQNSNLLLKDIVLPPGLDCQ